MIISVPKSLASIAIGFASFHFRFRVPIIYINRTRPAPVISLKQEEHDFLCPPFSRREDQHKNNKKRKKGAGM
jgi:hypothetical protein